MSIVDITELSKVFKDKASKAELQTYIEKQHQTINELMKRVQLAEEENKHLKDLLMSANSGLLIKDTKVTSSHISDAELIADMELKKLADISKVRPLNLDESKRYQIFIQGKKLIAEQSSKRPEQPRDVTPTSVVDLIQIARTPAPGDTDDSVGQ